MILSIVGLCICSFGLGIDKNYMISYLLNRPYVAIDMAGCEWIGPSPAANVGTMLYFYGIGNKYFLDNFSLGLISQYKSAGYTPQQAMNGMKKLKSCINYMSKFDWRIK